jgi:hypothetical protein
MRLRLFNPWLTPSLLPRETTGGGSSLAQLHKRLVLMHSTIFCESFAERGSHKITVIYLSVKRYKTQNPSEAGKLID